MADLRGDERGQILLVAAFALAVIFVAMALIVNSAIFTENLASRGETSGANGALDTRSMIEDNVGASLESANRYNTSDPESAVIDSISDLSAQAGRQQARSGRVVNIEYQSSEPGRRIYQNDSSSFTNNDGDAEYTVVGDVDEVDGGNGTRAFRINASAITANTNNSAFEIRAQQRSATDNDNSWRARIYRLSGTETIHVKTLKNDSTDTVIADCEVTRDSESSTYRIDVTDGTIDGEPCHALRTAPGGEEFHFGSGTGVTSGNAATYDISFSNANAIQGNFSMVVYDGGTLNLPSLIDDPTTQPARSNALYQVTVGYTYQTSDLTYETDVRVAPGEPDA